MHIMLVMHYCGDEKGRGGDTDRKQSIHLIMGGGGGERRRSLRKREEEEEEMGGQEPREERCMKSVSQGDETHNGPILLVIPPLISFPFL